VGVLGVDCFLIEHRSATMVKLLEKHRPKDAMASTRHAVSATNVFKASRESDMKALEVYKLDGANFGQLCPDGKTAFEHAVDTHQIWVIEFFLEHAGMLGATLNDLFGMIMSNRDGAEVFSKRGWMFFEDCLHKGAIPTDNARLEWRLIVEGRKANEEYVMAAVTQNGLALEHASEEMKANEAIVTAAVQQNGKAFAVAPEEMKNNLPIVMAAVTQNGLAQEHASEEMKNNEQIVMAAVRQTGMGLQFANEEMKAIESVVMAAVQQNGLAREHASEEMKANVTIVMTAVQLNGLALKFAGEALKNNERVVLAAVTQNELALEHTSKDMKANEKILLVCVKRLRYLF
jgi:hypothetical protein